MSRQISQQDSKEKKIFQISNNDDFNEKDMEQKLLGKRSYSTSLKKQPREESDDGLP